MTVAESLRYNRTLTTLGLAYNRFSDYASQVLGKRPYVAIDAVGIHSTIWHWNRLASARTSARKGFLCVVDQKRVFFEKVVVFVEQAQPTSPLLTVLEGEASCASFREA